jgi:hypothetical protein
MMGLGMPTLALRPKPQIAFLQVAQDETDLTTYTFSSQNIGAAASNRLVICAFYWKGDGTGRTLSSATIGGVSAAIVDQASDTAGTVNPPGVAIFQAPVPTGTTATIAATLSGAAIRAGVAAWRAVDLSSMTAVNNDNDTEDVLSLGPFSVAQDSIGVAAGIFDTDAAVTFAGVTENFDQQLLSANVRICGGSAQNIAVSSSLSITMDGPSGDAAGVAATWR